ncbi:uncharacterized protein [Parasteatoda tepidariorum]|uniref:uncharacterized protein isoform X2 n=1 Tax=Parasteatoda tepidariorum TaxID=114398 RepID=UPI001C724B64|nr:serine/threonine-protein kinase Nek4 isoform X2 [Parasteatoda tepidariorum]
MSLHAENVYISRELLKISVVLNIFALDYFCLVNSWQNIYQYHFCSYSRNKMLFYALKRIDFHNSTKREQRAAHSEAKLLCTIKHPNIVTYLDSFFNCKGSLFIVMSYCEKGSLHDVIKNRNGILFKEDEIINWIVQICMALKYLHDQNILHRDLKTQNIFLSKHNLIKVGDFGISRLFKTENASASLFSSPSYTSPEVFFGEPFSQKSDVWSLGCCGYELATLNYAFTMQDISSSMHQIINTKISSIAENYSSELFCLISSMLNVEPDKRPSATTLLLNDYIRKHILLFLKDSSDSSSHDCRCRRKRTTSSGVNSDTSSTTCSSEESKFSGFSKISESLFKTVPDVNGNGDGNDNSQQQALSKDSPWAQHETQVTPPSLYYRAEEGPCTSGKVSETSVFNYCIEKPCTSKVNSSTITNVLQFEKRLQLQLQKNKSENSYHFLNSLTNSLNISRFNSMDCSSDKPLLKGKFNYGENPPKSAENLFSTSQKLDYEVSRRPATSAIETFTAVDGSYLPQIKENTSDRNNVTKLSDINLPPLYISSDSSSQNSETLSSLPNLEESIVDKFLLRNIMESTKVKQKEVAIPEKNVK